MKSDFYHYGEWVSFNLQEEKEVKDHLEKWKKEYNLY